MSGKLNELRRSFLRRLRHMATPDRSMVSGPTGQTYPEPMASHSPARSEIDALVVRMYQLALHRTPSEEERNIWTRPVLAGHLSAVGLVEAIATCPEARAVPARNQVLPDVPSGKLVQFTYELLLGRGAMAAEIAQWDHVLKHESLGRDQLVLSFFGQRATAALTEQAPPTCDPNVSHVMGTDKFISIKEWQERASAVRDRVDSLQPKIYPSLAFPRNSEVLVSAIASLYRGGDYIEQFLENITSQTIFDRCELIIIDADSPENEFAVISSYMERFPNIVYHRAPTRIGIYEAWNIGVEISHGRFITNTNLDDLRRRDSFERQVEILLKFPFVDVVYQDFYYSFDGKASFNTIASIGIQSQLPIVTPYNLMRSNSPHNAPMWRRALHEDVGMFDASYRSAGDYDYWLRCVRDKKVFYKINDPHVVYFVNPDGLSTQPNTRGIDEGNRVTREYGRVVNSSWLLSFDNDFIREASKILGAPIELNEVEQASLEWRYIAMQRALRLCSVASRSSSVGE